MGIELRYTCLNCKPSQSTRLPPGVSGTSRTSGNLASDRPDWVVLPRTTSAFGRGRVARGVARGAGIRDCATHVPPSMLERHRSSLTVREIGDRFGRLCCTAWALPVYSLKSHGGLAYGLDRGAVGAADGAVARYCRDCDCVRRSVRDREFSQPLEAASESCWSSGLGRIADAKRTERPLL
jgi:hypothetical protein